MAISRSAFVSAKASSLKGKFPIFDLLGTAGDDVDDGKKRIRAIEGRTGAKNNLHPFDHVYVDQEFISHHGLAKNVVINAMAVNQNQDAAVPVPQPAKSAYSDKGVIAIIGDIKAGHAAQNVSQIAIAIFLNFIGGNDGYRGGRVVHALHVLRGAVNLNVAEFLQA